MTTTIEHTQAQKALIGLLNTLGGKKVSIEIKHGLFFSWGYIEGLHVQELSAKQALISDTQDDPEYLTKFKISLCSISNIEVLKNDIVISYNDATEIVISSLEMDFY